MFSVRDTLQQTKEYNDLGSFDKVINPLTEKSHRADYSFKSSLYKFNPPVTVCLKLVNSVIKAVLMYEVKCGASNYPETQIMGHNIHRDI